mmetsp:Transcript_3980/g.11638  ORF Transcript_3980/g.11638 Transcript_3980/m.11638 type:complete len:210 (-) Transcript_3980:22-651(-)
MAFSLNFSNIIFMEVAAEPIPLAVSGAAAVTVPAMEDPKKPEALDETPPKPPATPLRNPAVGCSAELAVGTLLAASLFGTAAAKLCAKRTATAVKAAPSAALAAHPSACGSATSSTTPGSSSMLTVPRRGGGYLAPREPLPMTKEQTAGSTSNVLATRIAVRLTHRRWRRGRCCPVWHCGSELRGPRAPMAMMPGRVAVICGAAAAEWV